MGYEIVVIGASLGGMRALARLLSALPRGLGATVAAVLHRGEECGEELIGFLQSASVLPVREARDKDDLLPGGGLTVVQAPSEAECPGMPAAAIAASPIDHVLSLAEIPPLLARRCLGPEARSQKPEFCLLRWQ